MKQGQPILRNKNKLIETVPEEAQKVESLKKTFKSTVLNVLNELKKAIDRELKETRRMMSHQTENT